MATLQDVYSDVITQLIRDHGDKNKQDLKNMVLSGLAEETGEVLGIHKREIRNFEKDRKQVTQQHIIEELGDVLWYLTAACIVYNVTLEQVYQANVDKLVKRYG